MGDTLLGQKIVNAKLIVLQLLVDPKEGVAGWGSFK
jgi:hypothetical protein